MSQYAEFSWTGPVKGKQALKVVEQNLPGLWGRPSFDDTYVCVNFQGRVSKKTFHLIAEKLKELGADTVKFTYTWEKSWGTKQ